LEAQEGHRVSIEDAQFQELATLLNYSTLLAPFPWSGSFAGAPRKTTAWSWWRKQRWTLATPSLTNWKFWMRS
jgi:hypothetical protein